VLLFDNAIYKLVRVHYVCVHAYIWVEVYIHQNVKMCFTLQVRILNYSVSNFLRIGRPRTTDIRICTLVYSLAK